MNRAFILSFGSTVALSLPAMAASDIAVGPNAVVPDGAPLPMSKRPAMISELVESSARALLRSSSVTLRLTLPPTSSSWWT